jgi:hypothetical protein
LRQPIGGEIFIRVDSLLTHRGDRAGLARELLDITTDGHADQIVLRIAAFAKTVGDEVGTEKRFLKPIRAVQTLTGLGEALAVAAMHVANRCPLGVGHSQ